MLESNVGGGVKVELSHTRAQIEQMMGMMQQLLQAKSADGGQQKKESGGTGKEDANDDSDGAGRAPHEEEAPDVRVCVTTATAAGERVSNHSNRRASDGSIPADDTGRRPEVPAGVGPMIDMQRGGTRTPFRTGIATHDGGGGVLSSVFQRRPRVVPPVLKREKGGFQNFKHEFLVKTNILDVSGHFVDQGTQVVPVGGPFKQNAVSLREDFQVRKAGGRTKRRTYRRSAPE